MRAIEAKGKATLAVSGGTTPKTFFAKLSQIDLPWQRVTVTLVDERQVPETSERSNARLVRETLLVDKAAAAKFVPLIDTDAAAALPPFDVTVLGMGADGHTASFFPGGDRLAEAMNSNTQARIIAMTAPGAGEPRLTFTLPVIEATGRLELHIEGAEKKDVLDARPGRWSDRGIAGAGGLAQPDTLDPILGPLSRRRHPCRSRPRYPPSPKRSSRAARRRGGAISTRSTRQWRGSRSARRWAAPTSPMALPPAAQPTRTRCAMATGPNLGIVTAYNDMLSAHQPFETYPELIRKAAREAGGTAQVAGGVPAMCDGVTQGETGMELSLFSRDVIALSTAVALSHQMFDAAVYLGVCDKIVPGLIIGALSFGHLPAVFIPAGPMTSGLPNDEKGKIRQLYAEGKVGARRAAGSRGAVLSRPRHLHLLRHGQFQPDADGDHGPASAGLDLRQSRHAAARCHHPRLGEAGPGDHRAWQRLPADRPHL